MNSFTEHRNSSADPPLEIGNSILKNEPDMKGVSTCLFGEDFNDGYVKFLSLDLEIFYNFQ